MKNLLDRFAEDFDSDRGIGAYIDGGQAVPEQRPAEDRFSEYLDRQFPSFPVKPGGNCCPCDDIREGIENEAVQLATAYYRYAAKRGMRFGAQLMKELLEKEGANLC